jgi:hypothetical protein
MSDREFENYLALLSRLLGLSREQADALSIELRSHMEDRLDELANRGIPRDEAVQQALAEFGDAAGLARQFSDVTLQRKRRWIVRLTTFSLAAALLIALGLITFWPGRNAAPGIAAVVAQAPNTVPLPVPTVANDASPAKKSGPRKSASAAIEAELNKTTTLDVVEMPLKDVVLYLSETHQLPIILKLKAMDQASISPDSVVTRSLRGIRLATVLDIILEDLNLTYYFNEVLFITTPADAQHRTEVRIYDCRDILDIPGGAGAAPAGGMPGMLGGFGSGFGSAGVHSSADQLIQIVKTNVDQETWSDDRTFRAGSISEFNGLLVVTQTAQTHRKLEHLLSMLREAAGLDLAKAGPIVR